MNEKKFQRYELRSRAINKQLTLGELVEVFSDIKGNINNSSGYLGAISDRSKELFFNNVTVGEYLYKQVIENPHTRLKGQVFYRQDYLDEFETIWEQQAKFHTVLTPDLKKEIRDIVIFYQRRLKSQKGLLSTCEFESFTRNTIVDEKPKAQKFGPKVIPKSSPLFKLSKKAPHYLSSFMHYGISVMNMKQEVVVFDPKITINSKFRPPTIHYIKSTALFIIIIPNNAHSMS